MPRPIGRLIFLAILCLERSLPMGGLVRVSMAEDTIALDVEGRRVAAPADLWAHVIDGAALEGPRSESVQFPVLRRTLEATGHAAAASFGETRAALTFSVRAPLPA
jgi:histidine phosphotransferase ChpT